VCAKIFVYNPPALRFQSNYPAGVPDSTGAALLAKPRKAATKGEEDMNATRVQLSEPKWKRWMVWVGWVVSIWPVFVVCTSAHWKLTHNPNYIKMFSQIGWSESALTLLACLQLGAIILYIFPPTAVLGAVILTGYLGGAVAAYTRIGYYYPITVPLSTAMIAWFGIWLRDARLRALLPIRFGAFKT
jgi:DoxX-like family